MNADGDIAIDIHNFNGNVTRIYAYEGDPIIPILMRHGIPICAVKDIVFEDPRYSIVDPEEDEEPA